MCSSILIKCLPPYIITWIVVSFYTQEHNRHNRLAWTCPVSNFNLVGRNVYSNVRIKRSDHLATREMPYVFYWALKKSDIATKPHTRYRFKNFIKNQWQKESNTQRFERNQNQLILFFLLLFRRGIEIGFQRLRVFVRNCATIVTLKKALFHVIPLLGDLVIAYRTNLVVIMI